MWFSNIICFVLCREFYKEKEKFASLLSHVATLASSGIHICGMDGDGCGFDCFKVRK